MGIQSKLNGAWNWLWSVARKSRSLGWTWWLLIGVALPSAFLAALGVAVYLLFTRVLSDVPPGMSDGDFKDALQIVLALAAIAIGGLGLGVYKLLSQQVEANVARNAEKRLRIANAIHKIDLGLVYYQFFLRSHQLTTGDRMAYLDEAIKVTQEAYVNEIAALNENEREVERLLLQIRNNWAYYIYERDKVTSPSQANQTDKKMALSFVTYIDERKMAHPDIAPDLIDTVERVRERFEA